MTDRDDADLRAHDLNLFVVFSALMEERSVTRAAKRLHMSQSAVSAALGRLRRAHGDPLFTRVPHGVVPTLRAQRMQGAVAEALRAMHTAVGGARVFEPERDRFTLRIGMSDDLEALLMPRLLSRVSPAAPGMSAYGVQTNRLGLPALLESAQVDIGVVANSAWNSSLRHRVLFRSGYLSVYDERQLGPRAGFTLDEYLAIPHVMVSFDATRGIVDDELDKLGLQRFKIASTAHFAMAPLLLRQTPSVATVPSHVARVFADQYGLAVFEPPIDLPDYEVAAVWHQTRNEDPEINWIVDTIEELTKA
ncbi:LysR family transcriptional regulator [Agromyces archimandritae]|uniref:LysR family transcriptional regulator n=1 Tax=Agromyces archimandritae TaxID=2781962 RepID=A0A975IP84_9MICO|nr:LysR family transcriptional regulator [Agromyces archimandritae]QTX05378.1 LysR family transcriptional regulator [Agromyces archimandritae]